MKSRFVPNIRPLRAVVALTLVTNASAVVQIYDSASSSDVWDTSTLNWDASTAAWSNGNDATFSTGSESVTVSTGITLGQLVISSTSSSSIGGIGNMVYRFNGGSLGFGASMGGINTSGIGSLNVQINSNLVGTGGVEIYSVGGDSGDGRVVLGGDNTELTGGITLKTGLIAFTSPSAFGNSTLTLDGGGIFGCVNHAGTGTTTITGTDQTIANSIVLQPSSTNPIRVWGGRNLALNGILSGAGGFRKTDTGALILGSTPTFSGQLTLIAGSVISPTLQSLGSGDLIFSGTSQPTFGYYGGGETLSRQIHVGTNQGGILLNHGTGTLQIANDVTGLASAFGFNLGGGGVGSFNGIGSGALINFNKEGLGIWTVEGTLTLTGGGIRPRSGILAFSSTSSTATDAPIQERSSANGIMRFSTGSSVKTATANTSGGILGGWATFDNTTWAKTNGSGNAISGLATFTNDTWATNTNTNITIAGTDPGTDAVTHSLRFDEAGAKTLTLAGTNTVESGGILVTSNVGPNAITISGGTLRGANNADLVLHQFNGTGDLTISSIITSNGSGTGLTKSGAGKVVLSGANSYTGTTRVYEGTLRVTGNNGGKVYQVGSQGRLEIGYNIGTSVYSYGVTVNGNGVASTNGVYFDGGKNYNLQSTLRLAGAPTTVRQYGTGAAVLYGFDTNGTHLAVESTASGSIIGTNVNFQPGSYGYVMNIAPGPNTATGDVIIQGSFTGTTNANNTHYRKVGLGSIRIEGASIATTPFQIRQGSVILAGGDNRLGSGSSVRLGETVDSGLLMLEGVNQTLVAVTNAGTGTENRVVGGSATLSTLTINNSADTTLAARLGGSGTNHNNLALTKSGSGTLTLSGANTFTGSSIINAGTLRLNYSANDSSKLSDTATLTLVGNLVLDGGTHVEAVGNTLVTGNVLVSRASGSSIINFGALSRTGSATLDLSEANIARTSTPNNAAGLLPSWITIKGSPAANDGSGNIVPYVPNVVNVPRLGGQIADDQTAEVHIVDGGTTGPVTLEIGGLSNLLSLSQDATGGPATISLGGGDTLRLGEFGVINAAPGASALTIEGGVLTAGGADGIPGTLAITGEALVTIASDIDDNGIEPVSLVKSGSGSLALTGFNVHSGGNTLTSGQLLLGSNSALGVGGTFTINGGSLDNTTGSDLDITDNIPQSWNGNFSFLGTHSLAFTSGGVNITGNRQVNVAASTLRIGSAVTGTSGFTKLGGGTLLFDGSGNNWTGTTTVGGGVLEVATRTNDSPFTINQGATLRLGYTNGGGYASSNIKIYGDGTSATTGLYLFGGRTFNASGTIELLTAPTTIRQYGTGLAAIGMFDINGNGLNVTADASGSEIDANIEMISRGYGMSVNVASGASTTTGDLIIHGRLNAGGLGFYKRGSGSLRLNQTATTSNVAVKIQGGTVIAGATNVLGSNAELPISAGAVLAINGFNQEAATLSGAGSIINGGASPAVLEINQNAPQTFSGVLGGVAASDNAFSFIKDGTATLTLTGSNSYSGDTTVKSGTLSMSQATLSNTAAVRLATGATLQLTHGLPDTVATLWVNDVQQPAGIYTSANTSFITGSGSLVVTSGPITDPFDTWATSKGLDGSPGKEAGFHDDPDGDGFANGLEWILGGQPLDGSGAGLIGVAGDAATGLTLTFSREEDSIGEADLFLEYNGTLANPWATTTIGATSSGPDANGVAINIDTAPTPDSVTVNIPASNALAGKLFGRLKATKP